MIRIASGTLGIAVALTMWVGVAQAQESGDDARARTHFEAGRLHFEEGAYDRARDEFLRAWELSERAPLLINLATVEERLAMYGQAADRLSRYLEMVPDDANASQLSRRIENLRRLQAERDAAASGGGGDDGGGSDGGDGAGSDGGAVTPPPSSGGGGGGGDGLVIGGIVGIGVGVVGFAMQGVFGGLALSEDAALQDGCGATASCSEDDVASANTFAAVSDAMMVVGIVGVAAGATLLILGLVSGGDDDTAMLTPYMDPNGGGLFAQGQF